MMNAVREQLKQLVRRRARLVKGNYVWHELQRWRAYHGMRVRPELTSRPDLLSQLAQDGIVVMQDVFPQSDVAAWRKEAEEVVRRSKEGHLSRFFVPTYGPKQFRMAWASTLLPGSRAFFESELILGLARAALGPTVVSYRHELDVRHNLGEFVQSDLFHYDNWRPTVKAFVYLTDVDEGQGPFAYLKGSHLAWPDRWRYDVEYDVGEEKGRYGHFFPQEIAHLRSLHRWEEKVCTGPAGTVILADFRGLHRGSPVQRGGRLMLNNCFGLMNPPLGAPPPLD
jgi:hypothetical protein